MGMLDDDVGRLLERPSGFTFAEESTSTAGLLLDSG